MLLFLSEFVTAKRLQYKESQRCILCVDLQSTHINIFEFDNG